MDEKAKIVEKLLEAARGKRRAIILTHNNPDSDSIAGAMALKYILYKTRRIASSIVYDGIIGRAENKVMIRALKIDMIPVSQAKFQQVDLVALIDSQPGAGNNSLPKGIKANIVIDHHSPVRARTKKADFYDVRVEYGSTCTILAEYIISLKLPLHQRMATSLYNGIKSDIDNLARDSIHADVKILQWLFPHISNRLITRIEHPKVPREYFLKFDVAIKNSLIFGDVVVSDLKRVDNPDIVAEMSDFLIRMEKIRWCICLGVFRNQMIFSIRTTSRSKWAGNIATMLVKGEGTGGGHHKSAAGKIDVDGLQEEEIEKKKESKIKRFLKLVGREDTHSTSLVNIKDGANALY